MEKTYSYLISKNLVRFLIFFFLLVGYLPAKAQCFYVQSILVDACNGPPCPGTATEGQNEMFSFVVGNTALNVSNLTITWPSPVATNPWRGIETNTTITTPLVNTLNSTIISCGWLKEPVGGVLPANATVLVITSTDMCTAGQSFASLTDTLYVIFQVAGNTNGHFANYSTPSGIRTLTVSFSTPPGCSESVSYDKVLLINQAGGHSAQDGAGVDYTPGGVATYINRGCQAPYIPIDVTASAPASTCSNASPTLTGVISGPATTYSWTSNGTGTISVPTGTLSGVGTTTTTVTPTYSPGAGESGTVTFTLTAHGKCSISVVTNTVAITINPAPSPTITSSNGASICNGGSTVLTASGAGTFTWNPGSHISSTYTVSPVSTQIYSVAATNTCGTTNATYTVTVNPSPTYTLASNSYTLCNGSSQTFTVSGASTYTWTPTSTLTNANTANPTATPTATTIYSVTGTSANGCTNATPATVTVTINPVPTLTLTASSATVCSSGSTTLTASGANTYTWSSSAGGGLSGTSGSSVTVTPTSSPATYTVVGTTSAGCQTSTKTTTVTIVATPTISITQATFTTCLNTPVTFTASGTSTYTWTPTIGMTGSNTANPTVTPSTTTTTIYSVTGTSSGCTSTANTVTLTINPLPTYSLTSNSYTICNGSSQTFTVSGASTYTWTNPATLTGANTANPTASPTTTTVYSVTGTSASACSNLTPATVTVTVNPKPTFTLTGNAYTICNGGSQTFTVSGASTYTWTPAATLTGANTANPTASPTTTTVYSVTGTSALSCGNLTPATVTVNVTAIPSMSLAASSYTICNGGSQTFSVSGASTYSWTPTATLTNANTASPTANPTTTTVYTVSGTASGCASSSPLTLTLTVNPLPTISVVPSTTAICSGGGSSTLTANGASTYTWTPGATLSPTTGSVVTATPTNTATPTVYTVTGTDANNCVNKNTVSIIVNPTPTVSVVGGGGNSQTICGGGLTNATVNAITFTSTPSSSVSWTNNNTSIGVASSGNGNIAGYPAPTVTAQTIGIITASSTVAGCTSTNATQLNYTITINPIPGETGDVINPAGCGLSDGTITGASGTGGSGNYSYEWNNTGGFVASSSLMDSAGTYPLQIKDNVTGCIYFQNFTISNAGAPAPPAVTPSSTAACVGGAVILTANPSSPVGTTYNWTEVNGNTGTGDTYTVTNMPASPNPYTIGVTATAAGCKGIAGTTSITVNPLPDPAISSSTSQICQGSSTTLSVTPTGNYNYQWGNNGGIIVGATSSTLSVTASNTYSVTVTDNTTNCSASTSINGTITVNALPTIDTTGVIVTQSNCTSATGGISNVTVTGAPTITYTWTSGTAFPTGAVIANGSGASATLSNVSAGVYCLNVTDGNACQNSFCSVTVTNASAPAQPVLTAAGNDTTYCQGATIQTLTVTVASSGTVTPTLNWYSDAGLTTNIATNTNTYTPSASLPIGTTTFYVAATSNGCTGISRPITITILPTPTISINPLGNNSIICNGASVVITPNGANTYTLNPGNQTGISFTVNPTSTITYTIDGTNSVTGCSNATTDAGLAPITVNPTPTISINPLGSNSVICNGSSVIITPIINPNTVATYTLNPGNVTGTSFTVSPNSNTTYTIDGTNSTTGCSNTVTDAALVPIIVNPTPTISINPLGSNSVICNGTTVVIIPSGATSYTLNPGNQTGTSFTMSPSSNTTYTIEGTNSATGCSNDTADAGLAPITVNPTPIISINTLGNNGVICNGSPEVIIPVGANTYTLNPGNQTGTSFTMSPTSNTTYTIDGSNSTTGCSNAATDAGLATITVNPTPTININPLGSNSVICSGASVVIIPNMSPTSSSPTYTLNPGGQVGTSFNVSPTSSTTYTIDGTDGTTGCSNAAADAGLAVVTVNQTPTLNLTGASIDTAKCNQSNGGVSNISASNVSGGLAPYNYQWTNTSTGSIVSTSPSFTNQPNGTYSLQVTDANGCVANVTGTVSPTFNIPLVSVTASFITNPNPAVGTIPLAISFSNTSVGAINYTWSFGDGNNSIAINPSNTYTNVGTYSVVLAAINGTCSDTFRITVIANIPTTIIIPNIFSPNGDGTNDEFYIPNTGMASLNCDIYNRWGQLLHTLTAPNQSWDGITPNGDKAPEGTYMYILEAKGLDGQTFKQQGTFMLVR